MLRCSIHYRYSDVQEISHPPVEFQLTDFRGSCALAMIGCSYLVVARFLADVLFLSPCAEIDSISIFAVSSQRVSQISEHGKAGDGKCLFVM